jgi:ubiquinol-cytochrome c reductase cytochrome c subunit
MRRIGLLLVAAVVVATPAGAAPRDLGRDLYIQGCISCHGKDARGVERSGPARGTGEVQGAGPSLVGVGAMAADFYLRTGYMPLGRADAQPHRKPTPYTERQLDALVAYIGSLGGPPVPKVRPERGNLSEGLRLFTESCAGCHQIAGEGGIVTGAVAPSLRNATPTQIAEAVRVGPYVMPRFPESQLSDRQLDSIVRYVLDARDPNDRGGWGIGHLGPVPEGIVAWLLAGGVLIAVIRLIGARG